MTRASLFRETKGVAVEMVNRVFDLPAFSGKPILFISVDFLYVMESIVVNLYGTKLA